MSSLGAIAFDKTGTLTEGKPRVTDVVVMNGSGGMSEKEMMEVVVAVERESNHPLAKAVVKDGEDRYEIKRGKRCEGIERVAGLVYVRNMKGRMLRSVSGECLKVRMRLLRAMRGK